MNDSMQSSLSVGDALRSPSIKTEDRAQHSPMELDIAPSLSRSRSNSSQLSDPDTTKDDLNRKLTYSSSPRSRHQRPPTLPSLPSQSPTPHSTSAISGQYNNLYYNSHNVRPLLLNPSTASYNNNIQSTGSNVLPSRISTIESSNFHSSASPSENVSLNNSVNRPRTNQVFHSTSDLAAHYGIPTFLPPAPRTTPHRPAEQQLTPPTPESDFNDICSNYLNMLSQKPGDSTTMTEDPVMSSAHDSTASGFQQNEAVQALMDVIQASPAEMQTMFGDFSDYLTSPLDDSPFDDDLLTTPAMGSSNMDADIFTSPIMDDWSGGFGNEPLFSDASQTLFPVTKQPVDDSPETVSPAIDLANMWTISPQTPALDYTSFNNSPQGMTRPLPSQRRKTSATGTRKNVTPETLVPIDAPTQPRKYVTPSATSRKDVPAVFARKRARSQAFGDEQDELDDEVVTLPPNPTEAELIEAKRRQNTIAARRSRKRKLEYQRELEDQVEALKEERDMWKNQALTCHALLKSHGFEAPTMLFDS